MAPKPLSPYSDMAKSLTNLRNELVGKHGTRVAVEEIVFKINSCLYSQYPHQPVFSSNSTTPAPMLPITSIFVDGGVYPNDGVYFSVLTEMHGVSKKLHERVHRKDYSTNNEAEYLAVIAALESFDASYDPQKLVIHSDSQLVIYQLSGRYRVKKEHLKPLHATVKTLVANLTGRGFVVQFMWVSREQIVPLLGH